MSDLPVLTDPAYIAAAREVDRALAPIVDRQMARRGLTREELLARPHTATLLDDPTPGTTTTQPTPIAPNSRPVERPSRRSA